MLCLVHSVYDLEKPLNFEARSANSVVTGGVEVLIRADIVSLTSFDDEDGVFYDGDSDDRYSGVRPSGADQRGLVLSGADLRDHPPHKALSHKKGRFV